MKVTIIVLNRLLYKIVVYQYFFLLQDPGIYSSFYSRNASTPPPHYMPPTGLGGNWQ